MRWVWVVIPLVLSGIWLVSIETNSDAFALEFQEEMVKLKAISANLKQVGTIPFEPPTIGPSKRGIQLVPDGGFCTNGICKQVNLFYNDFSGTYTDDPELFSDASLGHPNTFNVKIFREDPSINEVVISAHHRDGFPEYKDPIWEMKIFTDSEQWWEWNLEENDPQEVIDDILLKYF